MKYRIMQVMETRELVNVFEGTEAECEDWMDEHADQFVESTFFIESVNHE